MTKAIMFDSVKKYQVWLKEKGGRVSLEHVTFLGFDQNLNAQILVTYKTSDGVK